MPARRRPVLVTGASSGIGRRVTERLSERGHPVFATARRKADLASLAALPHVTPVELDVTRAESIARAVRRIRAAGHGLQGLVNNAGIAEIAPLIDSSTEDLGAVLDVNFYGVHRMVRACFPLLRASRGRIVNISSINGVYPEAFAGAYCVSKYAVEAYSDVLRAEFAPLGIGVSVVEPGGFRSHISANFLARRGDRPERAFVRSPFRPEMTQYFRDARASVGEVDRTKYPDPRPVADAVLDALFSKAPKARYLVGTREETDATIAQVLRLLAQLNERHEHSLSPTELAKRLRSTTP